MDYIATFSYYVAGVVLSVFITSYFYKPFNEYEYMSFNELVNYAEKLDKIDHIILNEINKKYILEFHNDSILKFNY